VTSVGGGHPFEVVGGVPVVAAPEEIDITNAPSLRSAMLAAAAHANGTLVVDMAATRFCDVSGLQALLAARRRALVEGGELLVVLPRAAGARRVLAISGAEYVIRCFSGVDEALAQAAAGRVSTAEAASPAGRELTGVTDAPDDR
jgi:anti-sigma B factor antagonist